MDDAQQLYHSLLAVLHTSDSLLYSCKLNVTYLLIEETVGDSTHIEEGAFAYATGI
jgi:hypothetical protein